MRYVNGLGIVLDSPLDAFESSLLEDVVNLGKVGIIQTVVISSVQQTKDRDNPNGCDHFRETKGKSWMEKYLTEIRDTKMQEIECKKSVLCDDIIKTKYEYIQDICITTKVSEIKI